MNVIDFKQPSTWRGLLGLSGLIGWTLTPELRDQIAVLIAGVLCLIEMFRNERAAPDAPGPAPAQPAPAQRLDPLRHASRMPTGDPPTVPNGFNDR